MQVKITDTKLHVNLSLGVFSIFLYHVVWI